MATRRTINLSQPMCRVSGAPGPAPINGICPAGAGAYDRSTLWRRINPSPGARVAEQPQADAGRASRRFGGWAPTVVESIRPQTTMVVDACASAALLSCGSS